VAVVAVVPSLDELLLAGVSFRDAVPPDRLASVLGRAPRIHEGKAAPALFGHRNNQFHTFDELGIYGIEDHATRLVHSVSFVFELDGGPFPIGKTFSGSLTIGGADVAAGADPDVLARTSGLPFKHFLAGIWSAKKEGGIHVALEPCVRRTRAGMRDHRARRLGTVAVSFR
jgi:hypothetical protein